MKIRSLFFVAASALVLTACGEQATTQAVAPADTQPMATTEVAAQAAPNFTLMDANGTPRSLADFRGNVVVIEWNNEDCPFVRKHYDTGNMQSLQEQAVADGAVWLTIVSSAPGNQGYLEGDAARQWKERHSAHSTHLLLDPDGAVGRQYGATTTPDMRVINEQGSIIYTGGIDDRPSADPDTLEGATNFVRAALEDHRAGRPVATSFSQPYGCTIHYGDDA